MARQLQKPQFHYEKAPSKSTSAAAARRSRLYNTGFVALDGPSARRRHVRTQQVEHHQAQEGKADAKRARSLPRSSARSRSRAEGGGDPEQPSLRAAVAAAKAPTCRPTTSSGHPAGHRRAARMSYEEFTFEGYGPAEWR